MRDLFFATSGTFRAPAVAVSPRTRVPSFKPVRLSNTVAVIVRDDGSVALVDAGWSREACAGPLRVLGRKQTAFLGLRVAPGDALVDQLARVGIDRSRVKTVIATHLHLDHVGGAIDFPNAEVVCSDVELSAFRANASPGYRLVDSRVHAPSPGLSRQRPELRLRREPRLVRRRRGGAPRRARAHAGLVAVAMRGPDRCYVHVGDAAYQAWEWGLSPAGPSRLSQMLAWRPELLRQRYSNIRDCEADPRRPLVVPSHDDDVFASLPRAPRVSPRLRPAPTANTRRADPSPRRR